MPMNKIWNVLEETKFMAATNIGKRVSLEDLYCVWKHISQHIIKCLQQQKSIIIKDVGTFTIQNWRLDAGIQHEIKFFQPKFFMSRALMEEYDLHQRKEYANDNTPVTVLNLIEITKSCNYRKETVRSCLDEVIQCLRQLIADEKDIKLEFPQLGELMIVNTLVTFTFYEKLQPDEKVPEKPCYRYECATKPNTKNKMYPCPMHDGAFKNC